jgi:hypothetical protein
LHQGCLLLTDSNLLIEALPILCGALLLSLSPLALYSGGKVDGRRRRSRAGNWRRWVGHPCRRRLLNALALYCGGRRLLNALPLYCGGRRLLNALPLYCGRRRLLNALPLNCRLSWPRSGSYWSWRWCYLSPLVLLGCGLRLRRRSRFSRLARRSFRGLLFPLLGGRLRIRLFVIFALRVRCCACADHQ